MNEFGNAMMALSEAIAERVFEKVQTLMEARAREPERTVRDNVPVRDDEVRGNNELAKELKVSVGTVQRWKREGRLDDAIEMECGRVIIYSISKAKKCIRNLKAKAGRPKIR